MFCNFFRKSCRLWDNVVKFRRGRQAIGDNKIWHLSFTCWINKATDTHPEYLMFIAFPGEQFLRESTSMLGYKLIVCFV
jgi:hypothetical protein